jgi:hypothetical protein
MTQIGFINYVLSSFRRRPGVQGEGDSAPERLVRVGCPAHNCGGRCLLLAHVKDGITARIRWPPRSCGPACAGGPTCAASITPTGSNTR